jgi:uncharacterized integral membrane protein
MTYGPQEPLPRTEPTTAPPSGKRRRSISTGQILGGLLFVLVVVFIVENSRQVKIRLLVPEVKAPLYVAILIAAVLGALIAGLLRLRRRHNHPPRGGKR